MKTRKDFMKMSPTEIFIQNGSYKIVDKNLQTQLNGLMKQMEKYCFKQPNKEKWTKANNEYQRILKVKADNKEEWLILQKVAKQRQINLTQRVIKLSEV